MVAVRGARLPGGRLGCDGARAADAVHGLGEGQGPVEHGQPGAVREQVPYEHPLLAVLLELGPVPAHRRVQVDEAALVQQERHGGGDALGGGPYDLGGALLPRRAIGPVGVLHAAPQVHDFAAVAVDGDRGPALAAPREVRREGVPDRFETVRHRALDVHH